MSRVCPVTGKGPISGNNRSHSLRATRRRWNCNLQTRTVVVDGKEMVLEEGDSVYFDATKQHGMQALNDKKAKFLAIII